LIILDFGSGNTCKNDTAYIRRMIDSLADLTPRRDIVIKWQLFTEAGENVPLNHHCFEFAYKYAQSKGFKTTASVFDKASLDYLLTFDVPFVKLANCKRSRDLHVHIPRGIPIIASVSDNCCIDMMDNAIYLCCVSKYPAIASDYETGFNDEWLAEGISDHTVNFELYKMYEPYEYECHYKLDDSTGLDAGDFARTPERLREIL
jgi:sialic acid synthase SpsE